MSFRTLSLFLCAAVAAHALPANVRSDYAVKERRTVLPRGWTETGPASKSDTIHLQVGLKQRNEGVIEQHLLEISDPKHHRYGQRLTAAEVREIVTPDDDTVNRVHAWLLDHGINDVVYSPTKDWASIIVPIEKAERLLRTTYNTFTHEDGSTLSRASEWSLPLHLHDHIDVVQPTTSFFRAERPRSDDTVRELASYEDSLETKRDVQEENDAEKDPIFDVCSVHLTTPRCLRTLYGTLHYKPQAASQNSIGITNYINQTSRRDDIRLFLEKYRPAIADVAYEFPIININGAVNHQGPLSKETQKHFEQFEGVIDAELVIVISNPTPVTSWLTGGEPPFQPSEATPENNNEPFLTWLNYALAKDELPHVITNSYADEEQTVPEAYARRACAGFAQLAARGVSMLFASGDHGVGVDRFCHKIDTPEQRWFTPSFPNTCPWVTSVGATKGFSPEIATYAYLDCQPTL